MSAASVWLIRHGETTANKGIWSSDPHNVALTPEGQAQMIAVADEVVVQPDLIITSPALRAIESAIPIQQKWPDAPCDIWPIQEIVYTAPLTHEHSNAAQIQIAKQNYWQMGDIHYVDGLGCESFYEFINRVHAFKKRLEKLNGYIIVVGHGQFFKAFLFAKTRGYSVDKKWMQDFRLFETKDPIKNGEIVKL